MSIDRRSLVVCWLVTSVSQRRRTYVRSDGESTTARAGWSVVSLTPPNAFAYGRSTTTISTGRGDASASIGDTRDCRAALRRDLRARGRRERELDLRHVHARHVLRKRLEARRLPRRRARADSRRHGRVRARAPLASHFSAGRHRHARDRATRKPADRARRQARPDIDRGLARRSAQRAQHELRRAASRLRAQPAALLLLREMARRRRYDGRARARPLRRQIACGCRGALRRRRVGHGCDGGPARSGAGPALLSHGRRPRRGQHDRRSELANEGAGLELPRRQGSASARRRDRGRGQPVRRPARTRSRRSTRMAIATCRGSRGIRARASFGPPRSGRWAATS